MGDQTTEQARVSQEIEKRMKMRDPAGARTVRNTDGHLRHRHLPPLGLDQNFNLELEPSGNDAQVQAFGQRISPEPALGVRHNRPTGHPHPKI